jgi:hypothetical protein
VAIAVATLGSAVTTLTTGTCELTSQAGEPVVAGEEFDSGLLVLAFESADAAQTLGVTVYLQERLGQEPGAEPSASPQATDAAESPLPASGLPFAIDPLTVDVGTLPGDESAGDAIVTGGVVAPNGLGGVITITASTGEPLTITFLCTENSAEPPVITPPASPGAVPSASPGGSPDASPSGSPAAPSESPAASPSASASS